MKNIIKLFIPFLLTSCLVGCGTNYDDNSSGSSSEKEEEKSVPISGEVTYPTIGGQTQKIKYSYNEDVFKTESVNYSQEIRDLAFSLNLSSFSVSSDYEEADMQPFQVATALGYKDPYYSFDEEIDDCTVFFAHKPVTISRTNYDILLVLINGWSYKRGWASNFTIGESGDHEGFIISADNVEQKILSYMNDKQMDACNTKILITGYSRAAAVSNIISGHIDEAIAGFGPLKDTTFKNFDYKNLYAYTFATPAGILSETRARLENQNNIFNFILGNDVVPYVAPSKEVTTEGSGWDFVRYGTDYYLDNAEESVYNKAQEVFDSYEISSYEYKAAIKVNPKNISFSDGTLSFVDMEDGEPIVVTELYKNFFKGLTSSEEFYGDVTRTKLNECKDAVRWLLVFAFSLDEVTRTALLEAIKSQFSNLGIIKILAIVTEIKGAEKPTAETTSEDYPTVKSFLESIFDEAGIIDETTIKDLNDNIPYILYLLSKVVTYTLNDIVNFRYIGTLIGNISSTFVSHFPDVYRAWIEASKVSA